EPPADPPAITDGPEDVVLTEGDTANFVITATGTPPLTYQWFRDDTPLPDTNTPTLTLTNITLDDDGTFYRATVTGPGGTTTTDDARLGVNPADEPPVLEDWVLGTHDLRIPVVVDAGAVDRDDLAVVEVDLRAAADAAGVPGAVLRHDTLRVVEVDADGAVIDAAPPFQFDPSDGYEPTGAASGELLLVADGSAAGSSRLFHVYVDTLGTDLPPAVVAPVVVTGTGVDAGVAAISIETPSGTWWYDQAGGGFSSLLDLDGADWLTWSTASGSAGEFRGIPNLVFPEGHLHPGATSSTTTLLADGPLRASLVSTTDDGWSVRWDIAGARAVATVLAAPRAYWFLYEGTPGGTSDPTTDSVIRPGGLETQLGTSWTGDLPGDEWTAFRDGASDRSLLLTNRTPDDADDSYRLMNGEMTVFGFGRRNTSSFLTGTDREFTVELVESGEDLAEVAAVALTTATATNGPAQLRNPGEPRPNVGPTAALVATPNLGGAPLAVDLDASASFDLDGLITTTSWDLGDGSTTTGSLASHTYAADGTYVVTVTVTDDDGANDSASTTVTVRSAPGGGGGSGGARVADGLVALYDLDDGAGAVVSDAVGGHDLTITQPGNVTWVAGGLRLDAPTMITNPSAPGSIIAPVTSSGELTLEAWIESSSLAQNGPARIVTLSNGARDRNITLGQGVYRSTGDRIDVRLRTGTTDANGRPSLSSATGSLTTDLTHVVFTRAANGTTGLYLDGVQVRSGTAGGDLLGWDPTYRLVLGNETDGNRAWLGTLHLVAFYDRALGAGEVETNHLAGPSGDNELPDQAPTADVAATTTSGPAPLDVVLDGTGSSDADGTIVSFTWDLGDGTTAASAVVDHGYAEPGSYDVTLTVVDDDGLRATDTITITATDPDGGGGGGGGTGGGGGAGLSGDVAWRAVSSSTGDLPVPPDQGDQTISVIFDIDGDGADDIVVGGRRGSTGPSMVWYGFDGTDWVRSTIEPELLRLEAGGTFGDIDGDGDLDLVAGEDLRGERLFWWENPAPDFDQPWTRREIKSSGGTQHHDQAIGDVDGDGRDELVFWNQRDARRLFLAEIPADPTTEPWSYTEIFQPATTGEGLDLIDVDLDGVLDIVAGGHWLRYVGGTTYAAEAVEPSRTNSQAAAGQFIEGGRPELIFDSGDFDGPLVMYAWDGTRWVATTLDADSRHGHSLDVADVDGDGHLDIMSGEMALNGVTDPELWVHYGDGAGNFRRQLVQQGAEVHDSGMGDFDGDGDPDIGGKPFRLGVPRLDVWWNDGVPPLPLDEWDRSVVDGSVPWRTIFVEHGDIDGDGLDDVVTGGWWWRNPGSVDGNWVRSTIGAPMNQMAVVADFDGDGDLDVLGTEAQGSRPNADLAWAENDGDGNFTVRTNVADAQGRFLQGAVAVELVPDQLQVALSWEDGTAGLQMLTVPAGAAIRTDTWAWRSAHPNVFGEALSVGDIDEDDQLDLFDGRAWFRNDGGDLTRFEVQTLPGEPDRNVLRDVDGDGDLDAIVTFGHDTDGKIRWFEQGDDPFAPWTEHEIDDVSPAEALSLDAEDVDGDGDVDVVIGEHANPDSGGLAVVVYEQTGSGWTRHVASVGDEHHDGTQLFDADGDGDLDVVSIGWTHRRLVLFENRAR
ncbi:MAG: PKD domain-containing protein, partial [Actinomycetota bacterium]